MTGRERIPERSAGAARSPSVTGGAESANAAGVPSGPTAASDALLPLSPLSMAILLTLAEGDRHGYALMKDVEEQSGGLLRPGTGSLYAGLQRLMSEGLIRETTGEPGADRRRRYYGITEAGWEFARAEAERMMRVLAVARRRGIAPPGEPAPEGA
jgi:DNA-binding PadR family transcriptional regulator